VSFIAVLERAGSQLSLIYSQLPNAHKHTRSHTYFCAHKDMYDDTQLCLLIMAGKH